MDNIILENMYFEHNISSLTDKYIIECYEESYMCESVLDSIKTFFSNLKEKIKDIFNKIISKITGKSKENTNKLNEIEDKIKDNPKLGLVKVQIADPQKVEAEIDKQKKEYLNNKNKEKGKFKVDKKKVITVATVTVSLAAAVVLLKKGIIKLPSKAKQAEQNVTKTVDKCEQNATKAVENDSTDKTTDAKEEVKEQQQKAAETVQADQEAITKYRNALDVMWLNINRCIGYEKSLNDPDISEKEKKHIKEEQWVNYKLFKKEETAAQNLYDENNPVMVDLKNKHQLSDKTKSLMDEIKNRHDKEWAEATYASETDIDKLKTILDDIVKLCPRSEELFYAKRVPDISESDEKRLQNEEDQINKKIAELVSSAKEIFKRDNKEMGRLCSDYNRSIKDIKTEIDSKYKQKYGSTLKPAPSNFAAKMHRAYRYSLKDPE
jgi:hypothetical protein